MQYLYNPVAEHPCTRQKIFEQLFSWRIGVCDSRSLGAAFADESAPVLALGGDGSFGFTCGELETFSRTGKISLSFCIEMTLLGGSEERPCWLMIRLLFVLILTPQSAIWTLPKPLACNASGLKGTKISVLFWKRPWHIMVPLLSKCLLFQKTLLLLLSRNGFQEPKGKPSSVY